MSTSRVQPLQEAFPHPPTNLPEEDGVPLESDWHRLAMNLLIELVTLHKLGRENYFVGGNMFIYFSNEQVRNQDSPAKLQQIMQGQQQKPKTKGKDW